jgi:diguanylate cyclase (GGDEF)-like protein
MYGLSPEIVRPGCTLLELLNHRVATGHFFSGAPEQYVADILAEVAQGIRTNKITELHDGRIISLVNQPLSDGGWVATHEDITIAKRAEERISYAAHHDALTALPNRKFFCEQLEQVLKRGRRGERLAVLCLDLDHLKRINDTLGHPAGDRLLQGVAQRLRDCVRDIDLVARLGGDEFAIIQTLLDHPSDATALAMRVREAIHEPFDLDGHQVTVDISVGISIAPNDATELNDLLKTADIALYEAKNTGRGTYCFYEPEMNARMQARGHLERDLQSALVNGEFELFYQPVVSLEDKKTRSFEALVRWHHPTRGLVSPTEFIPVAEEMGLIVPLGEWVVRTACAEAATWPDDIQVAVNVSPIQLTNKILVNVIVGAIASAGISANRLELEITESVFLQNTDQNFAVLKQLHELGVQFAMDDFGTGYSSLGYLLRFPFSKIKIDRSFITGLPDKKEPRAIVRAIAGLARSLNMQVTAEGVETAQQLEQVRRLGCTEIQGYLFSPPRPASEIHQLFMPRGKNSDCVIRQVA